MSKCPFCGADIEESARFCLYCMQSLTEKEQVLLHPKKKPRWLLIVAALFAVALILAFVLLGSKFLTGNETSSDNPPSETTTTSNQANSSDPLHVHDFSVENTADEYQKTEADCAAPATFYYSCVCGEKGESVFFYGDAAEHTIVTERGYPATCEKAGLTDGAYCSACNAVISSQVQIPVISHTYDNNQDESCNVCNYIRVLNCSHTKTVKLEAVASTCTSGGLTEGKKCALCEEILVPQVALATSGHTEVTDKAVAPTCTVNGRTEGKHCSVCGVVLVYQQTILASGHSFDSANVLAPCSVCGAASPHVHNFSEKNTAAEYRLSEANCLTPATYCYSCACGEKGSEIFTIGNKGEHTIVTVAGRPATCDAMGLTDKKYCSVCQLVSYPHLELRELGHTFEPGDSLPICQVCGKEGTIIIQAPDALCFNDDRFRIDSITYTIRRSTVEETWIVRVAINCTNVSSVAGYSMADGSVEFYNPKGYWSGVRGSNEEVYLEPNESGTCYVTIYIPVDMEEYKLEIS
ncbi:MAG: hypothetical protein IKU25_05465 [Clostridia bacterium]|nr:hypothetical protein [Clostridia bacterium]